MVAVSPNTLLGGTAAPTTPEHAPGQRAPAKRLSTEAGARGRCTREAPHAPSCQTPWRPGPIGLLLRSHTRSYVPHAGRRLFIKAQALFLCRGKEDRQDSGRDACSRPPVRGACCVVTGARPCLSPAPWGLPGGQSTVSSAAAGKP